MDAALRPMPQNNYWQCALWSLHALGVGAAACAAARCCSKISLAACGLELGCWWCCRVLLQDVFGSVLCGARVLGRFGAWALVPLQGAVARCLWQCVLWSLRACCCRVLLQSCRSKTYFAIWVYLGPQCGPSWANPRQYDFFRIWILFPANAERQPGVSRLSWSSRLCWPGNWSSRGLSALRRWWAAGFPLHLSLKWQATSLGLRTWNVSVLGVCSVSWDLGTTSPSQPEESAVWKHWCTWQFFSDRCFWLRDFTQVTRFAR